MELQGGDGGGGDAGHISPGVRRSHVYRAINIEGSQSTALLSGCHPVIP